MHPPLGEQSVLHFASSIRCSKSSSIHLVSLFFELSEPRLLSNSAVMIARLRAEHVRMPPLWLSILLTLCQQYTTTHNSVAIFWKVHMQIMLAMVCQGLYYMYEDKCAVKWRTYTQRRLCVPCRRTLCGPLNHGRTFSPHSMHLSTLKLSPANSTPCETSTMCMQHPSAYISVYLSNPYSLPHPDTHTSPP